MTRLALLLIPSALLGTELAADQITAAMRSALAGEDVEIELVDHTRSVPCVGTPVFERSQLLPVLDADPRRIAYWRGRFECGESSIQIWARVRLTVTRDEVVLKQPIPAGVEIAAADMEKRAGRRALTGPLMAAEPEEVAGHVAIRSLPPGRPIRKEWIKRRPEVARGENVTVRVISGAARLTLQGRAESSGSTGQHVVIKNPATGKTFRAVVEGVNSVCVRAS